MSKILMMTNNIVYQASINNDISSTYPTGDLLNDLSFKYPTKFNLTDLEFHNWNRTNKYRCICYQGEFQIFKFNPNINEYNLQPVYKNRNKEETIGFFTTLLLSSRPKES